MRVTRVRPVGQAHPALVSSERDEDADNGHREPGPNYKFHNSGSDTLSFVFSLISGRSHSLYLYSYKFVFIFCNVFPKFLIEAN